MKLSDTELTELANLAIDAATAAGEMIARCRPKEIEHKSSSGSLASQVVTDVDRRSEAIILETLKPTRPAFRTLDCSPKNNPTTVVDLMR